jgi:hypothetical protein
MREVPYSSGFNILIDFIDQIVCAHPRLNFVADVGRGPSYSLPRSRHMLERVARKNYASCL